MLLLIDLGCGKNRLGASALAQVYHQLGADPPDLDDPKLLSNMFAAINELHHQALLLAYHDRSDGGLLITLIEMAFAGGVGLNIDVGALGGHVLSRLFAEELGAVFQIKEIDLERVRSVFKKHDLDKFLHLIGRPEGENVLIRSGDEVILSQPCSSLRGRWSQTSYLMQSLRDDPDCAREEHEDRQRRSGGLNAKLTFELDRAPAVLHTRPSIAIIREQGVNGQLEMAAAFDAAGFFAVDVHMSQLLDGSATLDAFVGVAAGGGFSYGDVLGAGAGWAKSILYHARARDQFASFFARKNTFALGVCNGCQMLSGLRDIIEGSAHWPRFVRNRSEQYEARLSLLEVLDSPSVFLSGMSGSRIPVVVSHGEGRAEFQSVEHLEAARSRVCARFVDADGEVAERYPQNPNGSLEGISALCSDDGRVTIMMPHPERVFRSVQFSWCPSDWQGDSPWMQIFHNARRFAG